MINKLIEKIQKTHAPIVVGLDPMLNYVPEHIQKRAFAEYGETLEGAAEAIWQFNKEIVDAYYDLIPEVKPQVAMYEQFGIEGVKAFKKTVDYCHEKGLIVLEPGSARGIRLVEQLGLPLIGSVAAGSPILAVENVQARYALDAALFSPRADFLLRVRGLSMINAGIFDGDLLAVHRCAEARNGQIVVARLDEDVTVKRFRQHGPVIELIAENPDFEPIIVDTREQQIEIEGIAVGLIRGGEAM